MNLDHSPFRYDRAGTFVQFLNTKRLLLDKALRDEVLDLVFLSRDSTKLINQVAILDQVNDRDVLDLEHLGDRLVLVDVNVEVLHLAIVFLNCIDQHRLEDIAGAAPRCAGLNHNRSFTVFKRVLPVSVRFQLFDVSWLVRHSSVGAARRICHSCIITWTHVSESSH